MTIQDEGEVYIQVRILREAVASVTTTVGILTTNVALHQAELERSSKDRDTMLDDIKDLLATTGRTETLLKAHITESRDYRGNGGRTIVQSGAAGGGIAITLGGIIAIIGKALGTW